MDEDEDHLHRFRAARLVLGLRQAGVMDQRVLEALEKTPREPFAPRAFVASAWENVELPIDCGQSLTRPLLCGQMIAALSIARESVVLEIGTGSGYCAAVMSRLARRVYSIDRYRTLITRARSTLDVMGVSRVELRVSDGLFGWPEAAPFDRILLMGAVAGVVPDPLIAQLAPGGIIVAPVERPEGQAVMRLERQPDGKITETVLMAGSFMKLEPGVAREL